MTDDAETADVTAAGMSLKYGSCDMIDCTSGENGDCGVHRFGVDVGVFCGDIDAKPVYTAITVLTGSTIYHVT